MSIGWWDFYVRRWDEVRNSITRLTTLGRFQAFLLLANLIGTFVVIYVVSSETRSIHPDAITVSFGIEFIILSFISFSYSVTVENIYAFIALIVLQVEFNAFGTFSAIVGVLQELSVAVRWIVVSCNWLALIVFLLLQRVVRQTWGWHQYQLVGVNVTAVEAYTYYQQFSSALILDAFHSIFFVTAERVVKRNSSPLSIAASILVALWTVLAARPLQLVVRAERRWLIGLIGVSHLIVFGIYLYFAIDVTVDRDNENVADPHDLSSGGERALLAATEWCVVIVRLYFLFSVVRVMRSFRGTLTVMFPKRAALDESAVLNRKSAAYMIDANSIATSQEERTRRASAASTAQRSPRFSMYDATKNSSSVLVTDSGSLQNSRVVNPERATPPVPTADSVSDLTEFDKDTFGPSRFLDQTPREHQSLLS